MNNNLVIGKTAQLAKYFPKDYEFISSRDIDFKSICEKQYHRVFLLFAEQRTFLNEDNDFYIKTNVNYTLDVIDKIKNNTEKVVVYSTSELWNDYSGEVSVDMDYKYNYTPYIRSKDILSTHINSNRNIYNNVIIIYPFNFNSPYRTDGFLFKKIFDSIINKTKVSVGFINFYRDLIHPSIIVRESINAESDKIIGSGELINVEDFVIDLYKNLGLNADNFIDIKEIPFLSNTRKCYFSKEKYSNYNELINLTMKDINEYTVS